MGSVTEGQLRQSPTVVPDSMSRVSSASWLGLSAWRHRSSVPSNYGHVIGTLCADDACERYLHSKLE